MDIYFKEKTPMMPASVCILVFVVFVVTILRLPVPVLHILLLFQILLFRSPHAAEVLVFVLGSSRNL